MQGIPDLVICPPEGALGSVLPFLHRPEGENREVESPFAGLLAEALKPPDSDDPLTSDEPVDDESYFEPFATELPAKRDRPPPDESESELKVESALAESVERPDKKQAVEKRDSEIEVASSKKASLPVKLKKIIEKLGQKLEELEKLQKDSKPEELDSLIKGIQALLDLARGILPESQSKLTLKDSEAVLKSLAGGGVQKTGSHELARPLEDLIKTLHETSESLKELLSRTTEKRLGSRDPLGRRLKKPQPKGGETLKSPRFSKIRVSDQRINDPRSLRETVRIVKPKKPAGETLKLESKPGLAKQQEPGAGPPLVTPKTGRDGMSFFQGNQSGRMLEGVKKTAQAKTLSNPRQVVEQIVTRARVTVKSGMTEMRLELNPRNLGKVGMHFTLNSEGELTARLMATNESVRQYLSDNLSSFANDLSEAGVMLARIEVAAEGPGQGFTQGEGGGLAREDDSFVATSGLSETQSSRAESGFANSAQGLVDVLA